jgi:hypothetical protein
VCIVTQVIRIAGKLHDFQHLQRGSVENLHGAIHAAAHEQAIAGTFVERSLGLRQIRYCSRLLVCLQVDHLDRVTVERSREKALSLDIDPEMIHATADIGQGDLGLELQKRNWLAHNVDR